MNSEALTFCWWSFFGYLVMCFGGATPIFVDLKDSRRLLMVLWKISCTSFSSLLTSKWLRLYLWRCCKPGRQKSVRELISGECTTERYPFNVNVYLFPALVQMLLQQVVSVDVLCFPDARHVLLVHFQAHRRHRVPSATQSVTFHYHSQVEHEFMFLLQQMPSVQDTFLWRLQAWNWILQLLVVTRG